MLKFAATPALILLGSLAFTTPVLAQGSTQSPPAPNSATSGPTPPAASPPAPQP